MSLQDVALGEPHVAAHNEERSSINGLQEALTSLQTAVGDIIDVIDGGIATTIVWDGSTWPERTSTTPVIWIDPVGTSTDPSPLVQGDIYLKGATS